MRTRIDVSSWSMTIGLIAATLLSGFFVANYANAATLNVVSDSTSAKYQSDVVKAADRLITLQNDNGSWDWVVTNATSPTSNTYYNIAGVSAQALLDAYKLTGDSKYLDAAKKTGDYLKNGLTTVATDRQNAFNTTFLFNLGDISGVTSYTDAGGTILNTILNETNYWSTHNGNYCTTGCTPENLLNAYKSYRGVPGSTGQWGIVPWDLMPFVEAAKMSGNTTTAQAIEQEIVSFVTDSTYQSSIGSYDLGLAAAVRAAKLVGDDTNAATIAAILSQGTDGEFGTVDDGQVQTTAYTLLALHSINDSRAEKAAQYLDSMFGYSGLDGWQDTDSNEYAEIDSEAANALFDYFYQPNTFYDIQSAIDVAQNGDTINVGAGTYKEQLNITKGVTLVGDITNPDNVIIDGENKTTLSNDGQIRIYNPTGAVVFEGFKIINSGISSTGLSSGNGIYLDILTKGSNPITVQNCEIIGHGSSLDPGWDYALWAYGSTGELTIKDNYFNDTYHGILLERQYGAATVENNTFDALYTGTLNSTKYGGRAIEVIDYGTTDVTSLQKFSGNKFLNFKSTGIQITGGFGSETPRKFTNVLIDNNNFDFSTTDISNFNGAIYLANISTSNNSPDGGVSAVISNNYIHVPSGSGVVVKGLNGDIRLSNNSLVDNSAYGLKADESLGSIIDAANNWWGSINPTFGSIISGSVSYDPWYTNSDMTTNSTEKAITSFKFSSPSVTGAINESDHTIDVNVPNGTDVTTLVPTIVVSNGASVNLNTGVANDFTDPATYTVTAANGSTQDYTVTVNVVGGNETVPDENGDVTVDETAPTVVINSSTQPVTINTGSTASVSINFSALVSGGTGTVPQTTINSTNAKVEIPDTTQITSSDPGWNGVISAPKITETTVIPTTSAGFSPVNTTSIEIGYGDTPLTLDKAVKLTFPGQASKLIGWSQNGVFHNITDTCPADPNTLASGADCRTDSGSDLIVWTKHFTAFTTYTLNDERTSGGGGGGGGGSTYVSSSTPTTPTVSSSKSKGDTNNDGRMDILDFNTLMVNWGKNGVNVADFNGDNVVDILDFNTLMVNWTK